MKIRTSLQFLVRRPSQHIACLRLLPMMKTSGPINPSFRNKSSTRLLGETVLRRLTRTMLTTLMTALVTPMKLTTLKCF